jgi:type II secretory pathway pseudopilin PulG
VRTQTRLTRPAGSPHKGNSNESGFTILETAISLVLMAIVGLGAASLFFYAARNTVSAGDRELAMAVAQQRMEQLRNVAFTDASLGQTSSSGTSTSVTRAGRQYSIVTIILDSNTINGQATAKTITVRVTPDSDSSTWARTVSSVFGSVTLISERSAQLVGPNRAL